MSHGRPVTSPRRGRITTGHECLGTRGGRGDAAMRRCRGDASPASRLRRVARTQGGHTGAWRHTRRRRGPAVWGLVRTASVSCGGGRTRDSLSPGGGHWIFFALGFFLMPFFTIKQPCAQLDAWVPWVGGVAGHSAGAPGSCAGWGGADKAYQELPGAGRGPVAGATWQPCVTVHVPEVWDWRRPWGRCHPNIQGLGLGDTGVRVTAASGGPCRPSSWGR